MRDCSLLRAVQQLHERGASAAKTPCRPTTPQRAKEQGDQQQVLLALRTKAKLLGLADLPDVASAMSNDFSTDMSISQVAALLPLASTITLQNVQQVLLLPPDVSGAFIGSQDVLMPNWDLILAEVRKHFPVA